MTDSEVQMELGEIVGGAILLNGLFSIIAARIWFTREIVLGI